MVISGGGGGGGGGVGRAVRVDSVLVPFCWPTCDT